MNYETRNQIDEDIIKAYVYGSHVYGCANANSDLDYIVIVESEDDELYYSVNEEDVNYTVYSEAKFIKRIKEHHISALECIFQRPEQDPYIKYFNLNLETLRREFSGVTSNSFVKCKKKLAIGEDYIGKKSMFHSLRILMFGIQIAKYGKITDYKEANYLLPIIIDMENWEDIKEYCQPIYNSLKSELKLLAPIDKDKKK